MLLDPKKKEAGLLLRPASDKSLRKGKIALAQFRYVLCQPGFVTGGGVPMDNALVDRFIDKRDGRRKEFAAFLLVMTGQRGPQFLDLRPKLAAVAAVDLVPLYVLPDALFC